MTLFVTGGGSGIGLHLARLAAARGERVAVFDLQLSEAVRAEVTEVAGDHGGEELIFIIFCNKNCFHFSPPEYLSLYIFYR